LHREIVDRNLFFDLLLRPCLLLEVPLQCERVASAKACRSFDVIPVAKKQNISEKKNA
jgi:hypothetical protein